ncbi:MAG: phenylalanine--tRNA ligase subunit beta [Spirochaetes bacterium]|nr:phenylalanine--tRNA ligase subunit beta [Spirochaetota bacterium]
MWISLNIISRMVDLSGLDAGEIASRLTMATAEIDGIDRMNAHLAGVITAKILDVKPHPNADKLLLVDLDAGGKNLRVVCGAPNHKKGDIVPLATVGTKFTEEFTVKKAKIRGEESEGMLCSEKELGLSDDHSGIMILPADTPLGRPMSELYPDWYDTRLEIDNKSITHRPDLWCHEGFAREIAALFGRELKDPVDMSLPKSFGNSGILNVEIENGEAAPRYCGLHVKNIKIAESPDWLKAHVTSIGMRPISNIVDVTNYVMAELGEPMHAFDRKKLRGDTIFVRMAKDGERMLTLDGGEHTLVSQDIVIADGGGSIALAGVMGGGESEIDDSTTEIVLEAANFNPVNIRRTAGRYNLRTEAAIRFEKSLDPENCARAIIRCYQIIKQLIPEAEAVTPIVDAYPNRAKKVTVNTGYPFIRRKLGKELPDAEIRRILEALRFGISGEGDALSIVVPGYRATKDVSIPDDIVEEVGRIHGYDNITPVAPMVPCFPPERNAKRAFERRVKEIMVRDNRLTEVSNYSFVGEDLLAKSGLGSDSELRLKNPLSVEQDRLRRSLLPNLFKNMELNQRYGDEFGFFEFGRVYFKKERTVKELALENTRVAGIVYRRKPAAPPYYHAREMVSVLLSRLGIDGVSFKAASEGLPAYAHPGRTARILVDGKEAGLVSEVHPSVMTAFDVKGAAAFFDVDADLLLAAKKRGGAFRELPRYPDVPFEVSVIADARSYAADVCAVARSGAPDFVKIAEVVSTYEGAPIPAGKKSVSVKLVFAAKDRTLEPADVDRLQKGVIAALGKKGYQLR